MKKVFLILVVALMAIPMFALPIGVHVGVVTETPIADPFQYETMPLGARVGLKVTLATADASVFKQDQFLFGNAFAGIGLQIGGLVIKAEAGLPYVYEIGGEFTLGKPEEDLLAKVAVGVSFDGFYCEAYMYGTMPQAIEAFEQKEVVFDKFTAGLALGVAF